MKKAGVFLWLAVATLPLAGLSGCSSLPGMGPGTGDIMDSAESQAMLPYEVVDIDGLTIDALRLRGFDRLAARFGDSGSPGETLIAVGDMISVTIWEAGPGGLFSAPVVAGKFSTGSNSAMIPDQVVGRDGAVTVPYAGRVPVIGKTARAVQAAIEHALDGKAIQPQVRVNVTRSVANSVTVGGEVAAGARVPLSVRGDRLLDVLATAGGVRAPVNEIFVELTRGPRTLRVPLQQIVQQPSENIFMRPDDVLTFVRAPQTFLAYGATGRNAEVPFDADGITLAQALTKAGGLLDDRSDPAGVFIFREEVYPVASALRPGSPLVAPHKLTPVIYHLNMRDPQSLFLAQNFRIAHHDLVYVSDSPTTSVQKVFGIISGATSTIGAGAGLATAAATLH